MVAKKPPAAFEMFFKGAGIYPERIPLHTLSRAFSAVQRLAAGAEFDEDEEPDKSLGLLEVRRGSALFRCFAADPTTALAHLRQAGQVLEHPEKVGQAAFVLKPIGHLSRIAQQLECSIVLRESNHGGRVLAEIEAQSFKTISETALVSGETSIAGKVKRVGGATAMKAALRVAFQDRLLYCQIASSETARQLGKHLYQEVVVTGTAQWIRDSWQVFSFTIKEMYQPESGSLLEALEALREAGGKAWDKIGDPEAFLREINAEP